MKPGDKPSIIISGEVTRKIYHLQNVALFYGNISVNMFGNVMFIIFSIFPSKMFYILYLTIIIVCSHGPGILKYI